MLSEQFYNLAADVPANDGRRSQRDHFVWIWHWLYLNQSASRIEQDLAAIESFVDDDTLKPSQYLMLAWKAEALEILLAS